MKSGNVRSEPRGGGGAIGPPPPDICNPLDRLARPVVHVPVVPRIPYPPGVPSSSLADKVAMNFAPPPRVVQSNNQLARSKQMKESSEVVGSGQQGECETQRHSPVCAISPAAKHTCVCLFN
eukprot:sb/3475965/